MASRLIAFADFLLQVVQFLNVLFRREGIEEFQRVWISLEIGAGLSAQGVHQINVTASENCGLCELL